MLTEKRHALILAMLNEKGSISVTEVKDELGVSESTIRRDIVTLNKEGKLKKVFGGAVCLENKVTTQEFTVAQKIDFNPEEKRRIARYAASLIQPDDFVYLDAGTTTSYMLDYIEKNGAVFMTNAVQHAQRLAGKGIRVLVVGGEMKESTEAIVGVLAMQMLQKYHFTKGFFGANGIARKSGATTPDINEAMVKESAMNQCKEKYLLCDVSKFGLVNSMTFAPFSEMTIITDHQPTGYEKYDNIIVV